MKKVVCFLLMTLMLMSAASALAANSTITKTYTGPHFEFYYDGTGKMFTKSIAKATHSYLLKNNTAGLYSGATNQGTTLSKLGTTTDISVSTQPSFSATVSDGGNKITVTFSGGFRSISYKADTDVAIDGTRTVRPDITISSGAFITASATHTK
jgi:hypothetical protein